MVKLEFFSKKDPEKIKEEIKQKLNQIPEVGPLFVQAYDKVLAKYPGLYKFNLEIGSEKKYPTLANTVGFVKYKNSTDIHLVMINKGLDHYKELMQKRKITAAFVAEFLDIEEKDLTPELFAVFGFLHEMGHVYDFSYFWDPEIFDKQRDQELGALPVPNYNPSKVALELSNTKSGLSSWCQENIPDFDPKTTFEKQEQGYINMPTELSAHYFARYFLKEDSSV